MINRYIDPEKIDIKEDCAEIDEIYAGERIEGFSLRGFELVEKADSFEDGIELVIPSFLSDVEVAGFHIKVACELSEEAVSALESLIGEVLNRIKGVEYKFRKEKVVLNLTNIDQKTFECMAKLLYDAFKKIPVVEKVRVKIILDKEEFDKILKYAARKHEERERLFQRKEGEVDKFYICTSCQYYLPGHGCVISPERPSPCGTTWIEAKAAEELEVVKYYSPAKKGEKIAESEYLGVNSAIEAVTEGKISKISLHSVLKNPPSIGLYSELIIFYDPDKDGFGIVDRNFKGKTPLGLTFEEMEKIMVGQQVEGFVGASYAYLKSEKFLKDEGGWNRVYWVSPNVYEYIKSFVDKRLLEKLKGN
jgi:acetyl-CoA decarbonylase/synthase complex subunit beta